MPEYRITWSGSKIVPITDEFIARCVDEDEAFDLGWDMLVEAEHDKAGGTGQVTVEWAHE